MKKKMFLLIFILSSINVFAEEETISKSLEIWSLMSFFELSLVLLFLGFLMHIGKLYYERMLNSFKLKLSGENFGIVYLLVRDLSLFGAFGIGVLLLNPDIFSDIKLALPFVPLGTIFLGLALYTKLRFNVEDSGNKRNLFLGLLTTSTILNYFGFIFVMESAPEEWVSIGKAGNFWLFLRSLRSNLNPDLSMWTFYICFPILIFVMGLILYGGIRGKLEKKD